MSMLMDSGHNSQPNVLKIFSSVDKILIYERKIDELRMETKVAKIEFLRK